MSEVTAKDLREHIKQCYYLAQHGYPTPERDEKRKKYLAAFDAMAEKAMGFEKLRILLEQYQYIGLAKLMRSDSYVVIVGKKNFDGAKLIEALKAVPDA